MHQRSRQLWILLVEPRYIAMSILPLEVHNLALKDTNE
jgi:hypothetical protein